LEANDWLREIEMKLGVVHANDRDKVLLAVQQLTGPALAWWQSYKEINPGARTMIWDDFIKLFREHHIPNDMVKLKRQEFLSLQQRNLSVIEYLHKFMECPAMLFMRWITMRRSKMFFFVILTPS
jgi:hypothetical protein